MNRSLSILPDTPTPFFAFYCASSVRDGRQGKVSRQQFTTNLKTIYWRNKFFPQSDTPKSQGNDPTPGFGNLRHLLELNRPEKLASSMFSGVGCPALKELKSI
jgi:hypothetical protein